MSFCQNFDFFFKTQENANECFQKLNYFLKTQEKNSFFRQVHYPALPILGRKEKPVLGTSSSGPALAVKVHKARFPLTILKQVKLRLTMTSRRTVLSKSVF